MVPNATGFATNLGLDFHAIPQVDSQLADITKHVLVCSGMIHAKNL